MSLTSNIIVGHSFDIKIDAPKLWTMSGHYTLATAGRLFKSAENLAKNTQKLLLEHTSCGKMLFCMSATKNLVVNKFYV